MHDFWTPNLSAGMVNRVSLVHLSRRVCHIQFATSMPTAKWIRHSEMKHKEKDSDHILKRFSIITCIPVPMGLILPLGSPNLGEKFNKRAWISHGARGSTGCRLTGRPRTSQWPCLTTNSCYRICTSPLVEESCKSGSMGVGEHKIEALWLAGNRTQFWVGNSSCLALGF